MWHIMRIASKTRSACQVSSGWPPAVSGHRYLATIVVGRSGCPRAEDYSKPDCPILDTDSSLRCDVVVDGASHRLTAHQCDKAFDFQSVCVGCPVEGSQEAEAARTVAQYVVADLTNKAAHAHVIGFHLGLQNIKKFMKESDGEDGFYYAVEVTVGETNCSLSSDYDPASCPVNKRETRLCSAQVRPATCTRQLTNVVPQKVPSEGS